uniref:Costars domain-containing protein n=1 Tax=Romanomermis culicivorax TaxID=13658 RepID=A0A915HYD2_ROMCU
MASSHLNLNLNHSTKIDRDLKSVQLGTLKKLKKATFRANMQMSKTQIHTTTISPPKIYQADDVFSPHWRPPKFDKNAPDYGRPAKGSLTEKRGIEAGHHICKEIVYLCEIIDEYGTRKDDGSCVIEFGKLFNIYTFISDKLVGMLLRARRHKIVAFEGEMLFQRRDDAVPVVLLKPLAENKHVINFKC